MKKQNKYLIIFTLLLVLILLYTFRGELKLQAIGVTSGDSYYDERCIDVTQYYAQGYTSEGVDVNSCPLVSNIIVVESGWILIDADCTAPPSSVYMDRCHDRFGDDWTYVHSGCYRYCAATYKDTKGGLERVLNYCTYDAGDILVAESFAGAKTITKNDLRYPIKAFCRAHPSIITTGLTSYTSTNIPQDLIDGKSVTITTGETITVFYTINNVYNLPDKCVSSNNQALNVETGNTCASTLGFTYLCTEGTWDALTGSCTVMRVPECNVGERLVINSDGSKVCIYNPPLQVDCPDGYIFDLKIDACYKVPESINVCTLPYILFEPTQTQCQGDWELCPQCPSDKICSQSICKAQCSVGIECRYTPNTVSICTQGVLNNGQCEILGPLVTVCPTGYTLNNGACYITGTQNIVCPTGYTLNNQQCYKTGELVNVCPDESEWDNVNKVCVVTPEVVLQCTNGTLINGVCYNIPEGYIKCPSTQVLNEGKCVTMSDLSDTKKDNTLLYLLISSFIIIIFVAYLYVRKRK